ncbi:conserved membrane hypothetical protein [Paraburkholderia piptadeniae]|uniref:Metal-binding integral membrane protein n=1 Tax=Paraburkholderia piptadeniae TaxID=1701573 RepID=A0A1N7SUX9_9BURK|nr:DUF2182 domain-containing protein [Paraburkholderia piptadeniae]SIT51271.1 conserved membrane hypothetical protein [Paraburkholderia piptadeniae]
MKTASRSWLFLPLLGGLIISAWLVLWWWGESPYARYLNHTGWLDIAPVARLCGAIPGGTVILPASLHVVAWLQMLTAMMLPTVTPLLEIFRRLTQARSDRHRLLSLILLGYLGIWTLFGVAMHALDSGLHMLAMQHPWLTVHGWLVGAAILALAGTYQFSLLKYRCLDKCRSPLVFVTEHWHGTNQRSASLLLGLHHGAFCIGCCWALMLLMFAVGTGSIAWMLALAAVMAAEKNLPWGRYVSKPLGVSLLLWAGAIVAQNY